MSWKTPIKIGFTYGRLLKAAFRDYSKEFLYFSRAKARHAATSSDDNNAALLTRKRAHHLERFLMQPGAYTESDGKLFASELAELLAKPETKLSPGQAGWARRILREYERKKGESTHCPVLNHDLKRKPSPVDTDRLMSLLRSRRSRRVFKDEPLTEREKLLITEAAQLAPSSCNRQTLDLIFVEEPKLKQFVASTVPGGHQFFEKAPAIVILVSDARDYKYPEDRTAPFIDAAAAVENVYLLCETTDLGCCWGSYTSFGNISREQEVKKRLGIPDTHLIVASLALGKSEQFVCDIPREPSKQRYGTNSFRRD